MSEELMNVQPHGTVSFANEVLETIAGIAVAEVPGIANMSGGFKDGINDLIGKKKLSKGVKATKTEDSHCGVWRKSTGSLREHSGKRVQCC